ncbi:hypothetical protein KBD81_02630 [Candidatus Woesebacteria bacterium]|nr:hypothetical protein [Candidatus Woesebacteria bacterium]
MKHNLISAIRNTILTCATIHLVFLGVVAIMHRDLGPLNGFSILQLNFLFPELAVGVTNFIFSYILIGGIVVFYYLRSARSK